MIPGLFVIERGPDLRIALCLGGRGPAAWFLSEDGEVRALDWRTFHADYQLVGHFPDLADYRFISPARALADWQTGVFSTGFAAATRAQWQLTTG